MRAPSASWRSLFVGSLWLLAVIGARAGDATPADSQAVRAVIAAQLEAMARDDEDKAFSYASTALRTQFRDAHTFMAMVRDHYAMVIRPVALSFFTLQTEGTSGLQAVLMRDREGRSWMARYVLTRDADGHWTIDGCEVTEDDGRSTT